MIDAAKIEELRGLLEQAIGGLEEGCLPCAHCGHDEPTGDMDVLYELRAMHRIVTTALAASLASAGEDGTACAACGGPYPNADCGHAKNAADFFQPAPCRPDTTSAESSEALVAELREKVVEECARDIEPGRWRDYDMEAANDPEWAAKHVEVSLRQARAVIARTLEWLEARSETYGEKQRLHALACFLSPREREK